MQEKVTIKVNAGNVIGGLAHTWNYIGYDECNYTHSPGGMALIEKFGRLEKPYYMRAHHMLCNGIMHGFYKWGSTNAYTEDAEGNPIYYFDLIDEMVDIWLRNNCIPFFEIGFMPRDLADPRAAADGKAYQISGIGSEYQRMGWAMPPKDYEKWYDLIFALVSHLVERWGRAEVERWYFEMWNEPDIMYWRGTTEEFCKLYDYTEAAVHAALPTARFGGPSTTGNPSVEGKANVFLRGFLTHVRDGVNYYSGEQGTRIDFTSFHTKGGGYRFNALAEKQLPSIQTFIQNVEAGTTVIRELGFDHLECVLSEADPDGWAAGGRFDNFNLNFRNTEYYASYVASGYFNIYRLAERLGMDIRPLAWAFMFEGERCFEGTRTFSTQGIDKAVFNLLKLYAKLGSRRVSLESSRGLDPLAYSDKNATAEGPEVNGWATVTDRGAQILIYCHHDDWDIREDFDVELTIDDIPHRGRAVVSHYRIDADHSNAYAEWVRQGRPNYPSGEQYSAIKSRDGLEKLTPDETVVIDGEYSARFTLPTHGVSLVTVEW